MNDILQLKGTLQARPHENTPAARNVPKNAPAISSKQLQLFARELQTLSNYWEKQSIIEGCLIDVCYTDVIAKSNRISGFLSSKGSSNNSIVGARFASGETRKHVITHYVTDDVVKSTIEKLKNCIKLLDKEFAGIITHELIRNLNEINVDYAKYGITKTAFRNIIVDTHYIEGFKIPDNSANAHNLLSRFTRPMKTYLN